VLKAAASVASRHGFHTVAKHLTGAAHAAHETGIEGGGASHSNYKDAEALIRKALTELDATGGNDTKLLPPTFELSIEFC